MSAGGTRRVLNVGGGSKAIALPAQYAGWEQVRLDIDAAVSPDVVCDARELASLPAATYDAVYCSHNLEHYYPHDVPRVLAGFRHVLKDGGFAHIAVPDIAEVMRAAVSRGLDVTDVLYQSPAGPITVHDVLYGLAAELRRSGTDFYAHKTGFTPRLLSAAIAAAGFAPAFVRSAELEIQVIAFKGPPAAYAAQLFGLAVPGA